MSSFIVTFFAKANLMLSHLEKKIQENIYISVQQCFKVWPPTVTFFAEAISTKKIFFWRKEHWNKYIFCSAVFQSDPSYCDIFYGGQLDLKGSKITLSHAVNPTFPEKRQNWKTFSLFMLLEVKGPSGPRLLAGGPSGLLTSSFAPFGRSGHVTNASVIG